MTGASKASEYTIEVDYQSRFGAQQTPLHLAVAAGLRGMASPDPAGSFVYLDLGCGDGAIACSIAAAYPDAEVVGLDLSASRVADARALAAAAGLDNVRFVVGDFAAARELDLPRYDFAAAAGIYTWLDPARRKWLRTLLADRAKAGALIYVDYAAAPGCAGIDPLYRLLRRLADLAQGTPVERLRLGTDNARRLAQAGARFFVDQPTAERRLRAMFAAGGEVEVHEVMNMTEPASWFEEIAADFQDVGLEWAASAMLTTNFPDLVMSAELASSVGVDDPWLQETLKDVALSTGRRADVFVAGPNRVGPGPALKSRFLLDPLRPRVWKRAAARSALLAQPSIEALFREPAPATAGEAIERLRTADAVSAEIVVAELLALGALPVAVRRPLSIEPTGKPRLSRFNALILERGIDQLEPAPLVSPIAGSRVLLPLLDRLTLLACVGGDVEDAYRRLKAAGVDVDTPFGSGSRAFSMGVSALADRFRTGALRHLARLQIVLTD